MVDNNAFTDVAIPIRIVGGDSADWNRVIAPGTANAVFIEDNTMTVSNYATCESDADGDIYHQDGGRTVIRYNTFNSLCSGQSTFVDGHGNQSSNPWTDMRGIVMTEIYNNTVNFAYTYRFLYIRGGSSLIWGNAFNCTTCGGFIVFTEEESWTSGGPFTPKPFVSSWFAHDQINNTFVWGNTRNGSSYNAVSLQVPGTDSAFIQQNRDYFLHAPCGASDSQDPYGNTCSHGYESWPDTQGNDDMTFSSSGNNAYYPYTPYIYPHPLRTQVAQQQPIAPKNLIIIQSQ